MALAACSDDDGGAGSASGTPGASTSSGFAPAPAERRSWGDFDEGVLVVERAGGDLLAWCVLVADTTEERARGLMDAPSPDLGGYDGMAFVWDADTTGGFWMKDTEVPLSIAYVDAGGGLVSTADMAPCADGDDCPSYPADGPYRLAVEVPEGRLDDLGIEGGATVRLEGGSCPAA